MTRPTTVTEFSPTTGPNDPAPVWVNVTSYVRHDAGISLEKWRSEEDETTTPSRASSTWNNSDGRFTPGLTTGTYYPNIKKGRRLRHVSTLVGNLVPNPSIEVNTTGWVVIANCTLARVTSQFYIGVASLEMTAPGAGDCRAATSAGTSGFPATGGLTYTGQARFRAATTVRSVGVELRWYDSAGGFISTTFGSTTSDTTSGWTQVTVTTAAPSNAVYGALGLRVLSAAASEVHYADAAMVEEASTAAIYGDGTQAGWRWSGTAHQSASLREYVRFSGYIDDWRVTWPALVSGFATCAVTASSRLARLGTAVELKSIVEEEYRRDSPRAHFMMSEPAGSTQANDSSGNNRPALTMTGTGTAVVFGTATGPGTDGLTAATFAGGKWLAGPIGVTTQPDPSIGITGEAFFTLTTSTAGQILVSGQGFEIATAASGAIQGTIQSTVVTSPNGYADSLVHHVALTFDPVSNDVLLYIDGTQVAAGSYGLATFLLNIDTVGAGGFTGSLAHVAAYEGVLSATRILEHANAGLTGFVNETAGARLARYAAYAKVPASETSLETGDVLNLAHIDTTGKTALQVMREVETTENGVLFDAGDGTLKFHDRSHRYGLASAFMVSVAAGECAAALEPILDDQSLVNDLTATGSTGVSGWAKDDTSITDYGPYRESLDLATSNAEEPFQAASWRVGRYAQPLVRIPGVEINLNSASTALTQAVLNAELGTRFTVTGLPSNAPASSMDLYVEGMTEQIAADSHRISLRTSPASVFDLWILGDSTYGVLDSTTRLGY